MGENQNFSSFEELLDNLIHGGEIEFRYGKKDFSITHGIIQGEKCLFVMEQYNEASMKTYYSPIDVGRYDIAGEKIIDIVPKLKITFRSF